MYVTQVKVELQEIQKHLNLKWLQNLYKASTMNFLSNPLLPSTFQPTPSRLPGIFHRHGEHHPAALKKTNLLTTLANTTTLKLQNPHKTNPLGQDSWDSILSLIQSLQIPNSFKVSNTIDSNSTNTKNGT